MWYVYLLYNTSTNRTYIGCTTDYNRRLRQHNGEIAGGAKSTHKGQGHWKLFKVLSGFIGRSEAMRWEKILKSRARGFVNRCEAFNKVAFGKCPGDGKVYQVPVGIKLEKLQDVKGIQ